MIVKYKLIFSFCLLLLGCTKNEIDNLQNKAALRVEAYLGNMNSKGAIMGNKLHDGAAIGLSVYNADNDIVYNKDEYNNVQLIKSNDELRSSSEILITNGSLKVFSYYPYDNNVSNLEEVPLACNQTDYLWGNAMQDNISVENPNVKLIFNHVLSHLSLKVTAQNDAIISDIRIRSKNGKKILPSQKAPITFSALTGSINGLVVDANEQISFELPRQVLGRSADSSGILNLSSIILPADFHSGDLEFVFNVNDQEITAPIDPHVASQGWQQSYSYHYDVTVSKSSVSVANSSFIAWVDVPIVEIDITDEPNYSYTSNGVFLYYKDQTQLKRVPHNSILSEFNIYSNKDIPLSAITFSYIPNALISGVSVTKSIASIAQNEEKSLGTYLYKIRVNTNPNTNSSYTRRANIKVSAYGDDAISFNLYQLGVDVKPLDDILVEAGGLKWMPFNTSGNLALDVETSIEIAETGDIVNYAYSSLAKWHRISGTFFSGVSATNGTACPEGYRVPTINDYIALFGSRPPMRGTGAPSPLENKWLSNNPSNGSHALPNGVLRAIGRQNTIGVIPTYWEFTSSGITLHFIGSGANGKAGTHTATIAIMQGLGIWTSSQRVPGSAERVAPWDDGWANNVAPIASTTSQVRCVKGSVK